MLYWADTLEKNGGVRGVIEAREWALGGGGGGEGGLPNLQGRLRGQEGLTCGSAQGMRRVTLRCSKGRGRGKRARALEG